MKNRLNPTCLLLLLVCLAAQHGCCLVIPLPAAQPAKSLQGITLDSISFRGKTLVEEITDIGKALASISGNEKTLLICGTHPGDFNMVEYAQKTAIYWPQLKKKGITQCLMIMNGQASSCQKLADLLDLPVEFQIYADPTGQAGRAFGVSRGFRPDDENLSPLLKVTVVGLGFGPPWMTLPAVLPGYFGDPNGKRDWIQEGLKQGQLAGRWPTVLELDPTNTSVLANKFDNFPLLSRWGRRPFELATLRLQNLVGIQIKHWDELKPEDDRCLSQLGGCAVVGSNGETIYSWVDRGLCDVPDMDDILETLS